MGIYPFEAFAKYFIQSFCLWEFYWFLVEGSQVLMSSYLNTVKFKTFESFTQQENICSKLKIYLDNLSVCENLLKVNNNDTGATLIDVLNLH